MRGEPRVTERGNDAPPRRKNTDTDRPDTYILRMTDMRVYEGRSDAQRAAMVDGRARGLTSELNAEQAVAATFGDGPLLIIAGAGTGKTRTLIYRLAHLIEQGVRPERILLLTFTRRAAQEMLARAERLVGGACRG